MARVRPSINDLDVFVDLNSDGTIAALVPNGGSFVKTNLPRHDAMTAGTGISGTGTVYNGVAVKTGGLIHRTFEQSQTLLEMDLACTAQNTFAGLLHTCLIVLRPLVPRELFAVQ